MKSLKFIEVKNKKLILSTEFFKKTYEFIKFVNIKGNKFVLDYKYLDWHRKNLGKYSPKSRLFCFRWINFPDRFERQEHALVEKYLSKESNVLELGGFIGTLSCSINKKLKNPENHVVSEIHPFYRQYLRKNRDINECKFKICKRVDKIESLNVNYFFDTIICDIEGDEFQFILNNFEYISDNVNLIIVECHKKYYSLPKQPEKSNKSVPSELVTKFFKAINHKFKKIDAFDNTLVYKRK